MIRQIETAKRQQAKVAKQGNEKTFSSPTVTVDYSFPVSLTDDGCSVVLRMDITVEGEPVGIIPFDVPDECYGMKYDAMIEYMTKHNIPRRPNMWAYMNLGQNSK